MPRPTLTLLVPAFNEERRLPALFERVRAELATVADTAGLEQIGRAHV